MPIERQYQVIKLAVNIKGKMDLTMVKSCVLMVMMICVLADNGASASKLVGKHVSRISRDTKQQQQHERETKKYTRGEGENVSEEQSYAANTKVLPQDTRSKKDTSSKGSRRLKKRFLDMLLGDAGNVGGGGVRNGQFNYGSSTDYYDTSNTGSQPDGYWETCQDDPDQECYYYYDDVGYDDYYDY